MCHTYIRSLDCIDIWFTFQFHFAYHLVHTIKRLHGKIIDSASIRIRCWLTTDSLAPMVWLLSEVDGDHVACPESEVGTENTK